MSVAARETTADGYDFDFNGKSYHVGLITQAIKSCFEKAVFQKAKAKLSEVRDLFDPDEYRERATALADKFLADGFSMLQANENPLSVPENGVVLLSLMMKLPEMELMGLMTNKGFAELVGDYFRLAMRDSFPGISFGTQESPNE